MRLNSHQVQTSRVLVYMYIITERNIGIYVDFWKYLSLYATTF